MLYIHKFLCVRVTNISNVWSASLSLSVLPTHVGISLLFYYLFYYLFQMEWLPLFNSILSFSAQELSQEIKSFINGIDVAQGRKLSVREHARCAVRLLRLVPACRGAVLEHLRGVYDEHVSAFLHNLETDGDTSSGVSSNLEDIIQVCWDMDFLYSSCCIIK